MKQELYNYDIFPMVFLVGDRKCITVKSQGMNTAFEKGHEYTILVKEASRSEERRYPGSGNTVTFRAVPGEDGALRFTHTFEREGGYLVHIHYSPEEKRIAQLWLYALDRDMAGMYPWRGDLHMHTCRSDGKDDPFMVAANYRGAGYDFTVISDHHRYYPSLEVRRRFRIGPDDESPITDLLVVPGEEVHLPLNDAHFVNFGGKYSINALVTPSKNEEAGKSRKVRSLTGECPDTMSREEYSAMIRELSRDIPLELESERLSLASLRWISKQVSEAGGLGIFPHPYWLTSTMQLSESFLEAVYKDGPFDAFEVLGGESYYQHNGFQTGFYYDMKAKGYDYPVVGSTDSHGSTEHNRNAFICSTLVFAPENKTDALIGSIKKKYSVAVDTISPEYRLVGDLRWIKYGSFLMENWYPIHDRFCAAEGWYMRQYVAGDKDSVKVLKSLKGAVPRQMKKYFDIGVC